MGICLYDEFEDSLNDPSSNLNPNTIIKTLL